MSQPLAQANNNAIIDDAAILDAGLRTTRLERDALTALETALQGDMAPAFLEAAKTLKNASGRIIITGMGKSGHIARKIAATMASTGTPSHFVHPGEASHGDLGMIVKGDVVIAISNSGEASELSDALQHCKRFSIPLIAITSKPLSTLAKNSDIVLTLPPAAEACPFGMAPTTSTTLTLALGDALSVALMEMHGFTQMHYGTLHPGGKLGKMLIKTADIMQKDDALPLVETGTLLPEALLVMSNKRLGCIGVIDAEGKLAGVMTDGDLRRAYNKNAEAGLQPAALFAQKIDDVMTRTPKTMPHNTLAVEAVAFMNQSEITQLFITDAQKPVGILHIHDCLRAGLA